MTSCRLCGRTNVRLIQRGVRHDDAAEVFRCTCGAVFLEPQPTADELARYYAEEYRITNPHPASAETMRDFLRRRQMLAPHLGRDVTLLEVGAGSGEFLELVRPLVRRADGIEPEQGSALADVAARYDVVCAFHVLEHVPDPVAFVAAMRERAAPGGTVIVEVPNVDDVLVRLPWFRPWYFQKAHLWYFSPATLVRVFELAGVEAGITQFQRYGLSNHLHWLRRREPGGSGRYPVPAAVDRGYERLLVGLGVADTLWAVAR